MLVPSVEDGEKVWSAVYGVVQQITRTEDGTQLAVILMDEEDEQRMTLPVDWLRRVE
jgi:hypothetical protein